MDFLTTSFLFLVVTLAFKKNNRSSIGLEIRPQKSAFIAFSSPLPPLQTILMSDLVGCDSPLQMVMAVWRTFFKNLKHSKQPLYIAYSRLPQPTQQALI
jgi:hypothetical protein